MICAGLLLQWLKTFVIHASSGVMQLAYFRVEHEVNELDRTGSSNKS